MGLMTVHNRKDNSEITVYDISQLLENDPLIAIVYSERSDGKSFQGVKIILDDYLERGFRGIWLRLLYHSANEEPLYSVGPMLEKTPL